MEDNYGRRPRLWLPPIETTGLKYPPVIQVIDEATGEIVYTLRCRESGYQPKVFSYGTYTVIAGEPGTKKLQKLTGIQAKYYTQQDTLKLGF
jgi:hypothetical protein